jgi:hypothetical protein
MSTWVDVFRRRPTLWVPPLAFFVLNVAALAVYRFNFASESAGVADRLAAKESQLEEVRAERSKLDASSSAPWSTAGWSTSSTASGCPPAASA